MKNWLWLVIILLLGLALRLDFLVASNFVIDADEAIVGLMGKHMLERGQIPTFYYGQHYMGSLEPMLVSLVFSTVGISNIALKAVPLAFALLVILLVYLLGRELGGVRAGLLSALCAAISPATYMVWSLKARGGFIELLFIGGLALLFCIRWLAGTKADYWSVFVVGLLLGFGWWVNNQIVYFMLPIGFVMMSRIGGHAITFVERGKRFGATLIVGVAAFLVGGLPYWIYNFQNKFASLEMFLIPSERSFLDHLAGLLSEAIPILIGARRIWHTQDIFPAAAPLFVVFYCFLFFVAFAPRLKSVWDVLRFRASADSAPELLLLFVFASISVFTLSSFGYLSQAPRYLLPIDIGLFPLLGFSLSKLVSHNRGLGSSIVLLLLSCHLASLYLAERAIPGEPFVFKGQRVSKDHKELEQWLSQNDVHWVRTNYWIGYRLAFETEEQVRFLIFQKPYERRIEDYQKAGLKLERHTIPLVLVPAQAEIVEPALTALGYQYQVEKLSGYHVIHDLQPRYAEREEVQQANFQIASNPNPETAQFAVDGDRNTRWGSAAPQREGMEIRLRFEAPQRLIGFQYDMGEWIHDYPRGLQVWAELASGEQVEVLSEEQFRAIRYLIEYDQSWEALFPELEARSIRFVQTGQHPLFDWSIAELKIFG